MKTITITTTEVIEEETNAERGETITFALSGISSARVTFSSGSPFADSEFTVTAETNKSVKTDAAYTTYDFTAETSPIDPLSTSMLDPMNGTIKVGSSE